MRGTQAAARQADRTDDPRWIVRTYRPADETAVLELMRRSLGEGPVARPRTPEFFRWKHFESPFGQSFIWVACSPEGEIVGLRAFMRWDFEVGLRRLLAVQAVDTATHPAFRRRGIFSGLTRTAVDVVRKQGVALVFNTPNVYSRPGYLKLGWVDVGPMTPMIRLLRPLRFLTHSVRAGLGQSIPDPSPPSGSDLISGLGELFVEGSDFDELRLQSDRVNPDRPLLQTRRTMEYLRWRYAAHPTLRYHGVTVTRGSDLAACGIVRNGVRFGLREILVSEIFTSAPTPSLLRELLDPLTGKNRPDYLLAYAPEGSHLRAALQRCGFRGIPSAALTAVFERRILPFRSLQKPRRLMVNRLAERLPIDPAHLSKWNFSMGDLEVF
jgi:GNAT superfamily N-acetyltransferase